MHQTQNNDCEIPSSFRKFHPSMFMSEFIEKRKLVHYPDGVSVNKIFYEHSQDILKHVEITLNLKKNS